jgi:hypothetical protein
VPVADLQGASEGAGEAAGSSEVEDARGAVENNSFDESAVQQAGDTAGGDHGAVGEFATRPANVS